MSRKIALVWAAIVVAIVLSLIMVVTLAPVSAGSLAAPTPIASTGYAPSGEGARVRDAVYFFNATAKTATGGGTAIELAGYSMLDIQTIADVGTVNTTTLKLQFSNDGTNWVDGVNINANITADVNTLAQYLNFGRYTRVYATLTNSNPITLTVIAVAK